MVVAYLSIYLYLTAVITYTVGSPLIELKQPAKFAGCLRFGRWLEFWLTRESAYIYVASTCPRGTC